jgi:hypothetical protein
VPVNQELFRKSAARAARSAVVFALAIFAAILLRAVLDGLFGRRWFWNWQAAIALSLRSWEGVASAFYSCTGLSLFAPGYLQVKY